MNAREWLGLQPTHNPNRWFLPVVPGISTGGGFLFGGCGLGAAISALEGTTDRQIVWATAQYLSFARPGSILDIDVTVAAAGKATTQARAIGHVGGTEILTLTSDFIADVMAGKQAVRTALTDASTRIQRVLELVNMAHAANLQLPTRQIDLLGVSAR